GAASPTPRYSIIVSIMSSMSSWSGGFAISERVSASAFIRSTGWPIRATFRIAIRRELYWSADDGRIPSLPVLPALRRGDGAPAAQDDGAGAPRVRALRLHLLLGSENRRG